MSIYFGLFVSSSDLMILNRGKWKNKPPGPTKCVVITNMLSDLNWTVEADVTQLKEDVRAQCHGGVSLVPRMLRPVSNAIIGTHILTRLRTASHTHTH